MDDEANARGEGNRGGGEEEDDDGDDVLELSTDDDEEEFVDDDELFASVALGEFVRFSLVSSSFEGEEEEAPNRS